MKRIKVFLLNNKFTVLYIGLLVLTNLVLVSNLNIQHLLMITSFVFLMILLAKLKYSFPFTFLFSLLLAVDVYFAFLIKERLSIGAVASIMETNVGEAKSMGKEFFFSGILIFIFVFTIVILAQREMAKLRISWKIALIIFAGYWGVFAPIYIRSKALKSNIHDRDNRFVMAIYDASFSRFPLIYGNLISLAAYKVEMDVLKDYANQKRNFPNGVVLNKTNKTPPKIYLIIGESANREHLSLYGYDQPTTPFLDSLSREGDVELGFYQGISSGSITRDALEMALTFSTPLDNQLMHTQYNLLEMASEADYEVLWVANQGRLGVEETFLGLLSVKADFYFENKDSYPGDDLKIFELKEAFSRIAKGERVLTIFHLEGSHQSYSDRFDAVDSDAIKGSGDIVDYDRTILHTDRFLRRLHATIEANGDPYVLLYFSDHGEIIGKGHGYMNGGVDQFKVPFITLQKGSYPIDSLVQNYVDKEANLINNMSVVNIISGLMGYQFPEEDVNKVLEASKYVRHVDQNTYLYEELKEKYGE